MTGFLGFDGPGVANTAPHSDHPALVTADQNPTLFGAKFDGVTDDTAAWNAAIVAAKKTGGAVLFPAAQSVIAGQVTLLPGVWITGVVPGPFDVGLSPVLNVLGPTFLITNASTTPFVMSSRDCGIQDVLVHYPNQVFPGSNTPTSYPATFSTPAGSAGCHFRRITLTNAYQGFSLLGGRHFLTDINAGCFSNVATIDNSLDVIHFNRVVASPFWDNAAQVNYPQNIDTWVANNRIDYIFYRADGAVLSDIFGFAGFVGMEMLDSALAISPTPSYGAADNVRFDTYATGIICNSTQPPGWQFSNYSVNSTTAPINMSAGGGTAPKLRVQGGSFWGSAKVPTNTAGGLTIRDIENLMPTGNSGIGTPNIPNSTVTVANPNPYAVLVCITAGAGSTCVVAMGPGAASGFTLAASGTATVVLAANEGIKLTYTSAPTWVWFGI